MSFSSPLQKVLPKVLPLAKSKNRYILHELQAKDADRALGFIANTFAENEPLNIFFKIPRSANFNCFRSLYNQTIPTLSTVIEDEEDRIVGAGLRYEVDIQAPPSPEESFLPRYLSQLLGQMEEDYKQYYRANNLKGRVMCFFASAVDPTIRGHRLAEYLGYGSCLLAKQYGYTRCMVESTNMFGAAYVQSLGFKPIKAYKYADWEYDGEDAPRYPFKDLNEGFTRIVNERNGYPKYTNAAEACILMDTAIDTILEQAERLGL
jgi:predicted N-acetyltransferase YhbS